MKTSLPLLAVLLSSLAPVFGGEPNAGFTAHEWGTFTSVQGADGVQMEWNPLVVSDLPKFVYERNRVLAGKPVLAFKTGLVCRQRMETPVIYFYTDQVRTVDVRVNFPEGQITEWYPQQTAGDLGPRRGERAKTVPALHWKDVSLIPGLISSTTPPRAGDSGSHYFAARGTGSAHVYAKTPGGKSEVEEFLFYRGTGSFTAPLTVKLASADPQRVALTNTGKEPLRHLFLCEIRADGAVWLALQNLAPGETRATTLSTTKAAETATLAAALRTALVAEGLYEKEAAAMVKTWETSWLGERGLRVLYTLPRGWTDAALPLAITPAPEAIERVMVGRAEIITPAMEVALLSSVQRYLAGTAGTRPQVIADTRALGLGRFTEATLRRLMAAEKRAPEFSAYSWELLEKISAPVKAVARQE